MKPVHTKPVSGKPRLTPQPQAREGRGRATQPRGPEAPPSILRCAPGPASTWIFSKCTSRLRRCETWPRNLQHESSIRSALSASRAARQTLALASYGVQRFSGLHHPTSAHRAGRTTSRAGPSRASPYLSSESDSGHPAGRLGRCRSAFENAGQRNLASNARARPPTTARQSHVLCRCRGVCATGRLRDFRCSLCKIATAAWRWGFFTTRTARVPHLDQSTVDARPRCGH